MRIQTTGEQLVTITRVCHECNQPRTVQCLRSEYEAWYGGTLIQVAMPNLSADERELLISGICGQCFDNLFQLEN